MTKRPKKEYPENVDKSTMPIPNSRAAELFKESGEAIQMVSNLAELLLVVDLEALKHTRLDYHEPVSFAFRAFGEVISHYALKGLDKLERAQRECGLDPFN
ncbi:MAG: hypothetical protein WB816_01050 [Methylocystis sp.]